VKNSQIIDEIIVSFQKYPGIVFTCELQTLLSLFSEII